MTTSADSRFRQKLPFALLPISPSLAAIHAGRARRLNPEDATLTLSFCRGCGAYLLNGSATIRSKRVRTGRSKRARRTLEARCGVCGEMNQADLPPAAVDPAVSPRPPTRTPALPILAPTPTPTVSLAPTPIPQLGRSSTAAHQAGDTGSGHSPAPIDVKSKKSRPKNKGLQELLARKKQAEAAAATASARSGGLSSFLSEL